MPLGANLRDVIISEVAWGGTVVNSADEWIELYNTTGVAVSLVGWTLSDGGDININLNGSIPAYGYYLLEADDDFTISNIVADQIYTGALSNSGEILTLRNDLSTIIDTANNDGATWNGGTASTTFLSMERVGIVVDSTTAWLSNNNITYNGLAADGIAPIKGTPKQKTSSATTADLSLKMIVDNPTAAVGNNLTFTITVRNSGFANATNVAVRNVLPVGLTYVSNDLGAVYNGLDTVTWTIGNLASGTSLSINIVATVATNAVLKSYAEIITSTQTDPDSTPGNYLAFPNEDDGDFKQVGNPALSISVVSNNLNPNIGTNVVFTITVTNMNAGTANNINVLAILPSGLKYISNDGGAAYNLNTNIWTLPSLVAGSSAVLKITAQVLTASPVVFSTEVSSNEFANNIASATITPVASTQADLTLTQTWFRSTTSADTAIIQVTLTNQDSVNAATNVQVQDLLPSGLTYVSHTSGMNYNSSTGIWAVGTILGGASSTLSITVRVSASGTSTTNFAEVWLSDQFDIDSTPGNGDVGEDDSVSVEVPVADLSLTQTSDIFGSNAVFTIRVTNSGPDDASGVVVSNSRLSNITNYTYISSSATPGTSYNSLTGQWTIGSLPDGATVTLVVTTTVVAIDENLAEVSAVNEVDPDSLPGNNSRTEDDDAATPSANLSLTKTVSNINPEVGTNVIFTVLVSNAGYATATNVEVKDILPSGLTYVSHTSGQTYSSSTGIWVVGTIPNGSSRELKITATVASYGIRTNYAEVWKSDQSDPNSDPGDSSTTEDDDSSVTLVTQRAILLNEIAWAGTGAGSLAEDEWIELYNPSDASITISGWTIRKNSCAGSVYITIDSGKSISRDGYFLLERGSTSTDDTTVSDVAANQIYTTSVPKLDDAGETLYLCDNSGYIIDTANREGFGNPTNPWSAGTAASPYGSMERQGNTIEKDSVWVTNRGGTKNGTNASGVAIYGTPGKRNSTGNSTAVTATPAPTSTPVPTRIVIDPRPIINEILARPGYDWNQDGAVDVFDEFIEIKNLTAIDVSLSGWKLNTLDGSTFTLPDVTLKPGERILYYGAQTRILLSDGGETVRLVNPSGKIYDAFTYELARAEDQSFCRLPDGTPGNSWFEDCIPTPYLSNTREGKAPISPDNGSSPVCNLPDTIPLDFFIPECNGYGGAIWNPFYWDFTNWLDKLFIQQTDEKWRSFIE